MDRLKHVTLVIVNTVCKVIRKIIDKMDFLYETEVNERAKKVCLVPKIYFTSLFLINLK